MKWILSTVFVLAAWGLWTPLSANASVQTGVVVYDEPPDTIIWVGPGFYAGVYIGDEWEFRQWHRGYYHNYYRYYHRHHHGGHHHGGHHGGRHH